MLAPGAPARSVARTVTLLVRRNAQALPNANLIQSGLRLAVPRTASSPTGRVSFPVTG
jgi:hypothetical protein